MYKRQLQDYAELEKIKDPELKNKVLDAIGTNNFRMTLNNAIDEEKNRKYIAEASAAVSEFATLVDAADHSTMTYVTGYETWNRKKKVERPEDADTVKYYYTVSSRAVSLYREKVKTDEDTTVREEQERQNREWERRRGELENISKMAYKARLNFIKDFSAAKKNAAAICRFAGEVFLREHDVPDDDVMSELLGIGINADTEEIDTAEFEERAKTNPEYTLLATAYAAFDSASEKYFWNHWDLSLIHIWVFWWLRWPAQPGDSELSGL